jgi:hypothetical protein
MLGLLGWCYHVCSFVYGVMTADLLSFFISCNNYYNKDIVFVVVVVVLILILILILELMLAYLSSCSLYYYKLLL